MRSIFVSFYWFDRSYCPLIIELKNFSSLKAKLTRKSDFIGICGFISMQFLNFMNFGWKTGDTLSFWGVKLRIYFTFLWHNFSLKVLRTFYAIFFFWKCFKKYLHLWSLSQNPDSRSADDGSVGGISLL